MSIGRLREFLRLLYSEWLTLAASLRVADLDASGVEALLQTGSELLFDKLAVVFNFACSYRCEGYEPVTAAWLADCASVRALREVGEIIAEQNGIKAALPFFLARYREQLRAIQATQAAASS